LSATYKEEKIKEEVIRKKSKMVVYTKRGEKDITNNQGRRFR
jgi:hypothetical protein